MTTTVSLTRQVIALLSTLIAEGCDHSQSSDVTGALWRDLGAAVQNGLSADTLRALGQKHDKGAVAHGINPGPFLAMISFCQHPGDRLRAASAYLALIRAWNNKQAWCSPAEEQKALDDLLAAAQDDMKAAA